MTVKETVFCLGLVVQESVVGLSFTINYTLKRVLEGNFIRR